MVEIYARNSYTLKYELLDTFKDEDINVNLKLKDFRDISKVYSTYSQTFVVPASDNNNNVFNFYFDADNFTNNVVAKSRYLDAKIYVNGQLFKVGKINITEGKYDRGNLATYSINFFTGVATLKDQIGDDSLSDLRYNGEINWSPDVIRDYLSNAGFPGTFKIPLISNKRVWEYDTATNNDIKYVNGTQDSPKAITFDELRPCIPFSNVVTGIINKYNLNIECPLFDRSEYKKLYIYANNENLSLRPAILPIYNQYGGVGGLNTSNVVWFINANTTTFHHTITKSSPGVDPVTTMHLRLEGNNVFVPGETYSATINYIDQRTTRQGNLLFSESVSLAADNLIKSTWIIDEVKYGITMTTPLVFSIEIIFDKIVKPTNVGYYLITPNASKYKYYNRTTTNNLSTYDEFSGIDVLKSIPNMKIIEFLSSFFKLFNISVRQDSASNKMYWECPEDFSGIDKDFSDYTDMNTTIVTPIPVYKSYNFTHKKNKYYSTTAFATANIANKNQKEYGQLIYNTMDPYAKDEYNISTSFSIIPPVIMPGTAFQTYYGFSDDKPTASATFINLYKPNNEFTIFYYQGYQPITNEEGTNISFGFRGATATTAITSHHQMGMSDTISESTYITSLGFKDEVNLVPEVFTYSKNAYSKYYKGEITRLLGRNNRYYTFDVVLPQHEILSFDVRNRVIIGNRKYSIEGINMNIVSGKCKLNLINLSDLVVNNTINYNVSVPREITISSFSSQSQDTYIRWSGIETGTGNPLKGYEIEHATTHFNPLYSQPYALVERQNSSNTYGTAAILSTLRGPLPVTGPPGSQIIIHYRFRSYDIFENYSLWSYLSQIVYYV